MVVRQNVISDRVSQKVEQFTYLLTFLNGSGLFWTSPYIYLMKRNYDIDAGNLILNCFHFSDCLEEIR